ncbi:hypothetical protein CDV55_107860 [Aspergillus turcosus]|uniref:Methyltransferase n=1 Tax=Aspergillus turcosus TaxID=1245748 RepID=A0A229WZ11_9EURO|nr:hypothetical protein CDV55_107860 [Aspergillus turcosus]RLL93730.1 hypothetical protein CFD26_101011 [Aspergillus turcosus]
MEAERQPQEDIRAPLYFLRKDPTYQTVKPYNIHYYPKEDFPRHNLIHAPCEVLVKDMRAQEPPVALDTVGFGVYRLDTKMEYSDFQDETKVEQIYCRELEDYFREALGAKNVRALDFQVPQIDAPSKLRRKAPEFPHFGGRLPPRPQPSLLTHVDVTPDAARTIVRELYKDVAEEILNGRFQIITVWKPCRLPVGDWPLAICDATSVEPDDLVAADIIYPKFIAENYMLHHNENQRWYWLPDQKADEVLVFKAHDSEGSASRPCPHGAFPLPCQDEKTPPRESIDVRLLVMYADVEYPAATSWSN